ncbi:amidohydrolase family protein [Nakamurella alba]|uniref:amidohydrolase family protein n=1 Tax=Nakamurella alba TaxID=2665158 RepID=UPI0018AA4769|nr:amidohydrolase family protein [Nakamurella alba]
MITTEAPCEVIDVHHHVAEIEGLVGARNTGTRAADPVDARIAYLDAHGIAGAIISPSSVGVHSTTAPRLNDQAAAYRDLAPDRFLAALGTVDPLDVDAALTEIDRAVTELDVRGFTWHHHFQGTVINDPRMEPLFARLQEHRVPAFVHILAESFLEEPWRLQVLADKFPELDIVALDGFSSGPQAGQMPELARRCPNITFDTGVCISVAHGLDRFIDAVGPERLVFGSDFYSAPRMFALPFPLYELLNLGLDTDTLTKVLGGNIRTLLRLGSYEPAVPADVG